MFLNDWLQLRGFQPKPRTNVWLRLEAVAPFDILDIKKWGWFKPTRDGRGQQNLKPKPEAKAIVSEMATIWFLLRGAAI